MFEKKCTKNAAKKNQADIEIFLDLMRQNNSKLEDRLVMLGGELEQCFGIEETQPVHSFNSFDENTFHDNMQQISSCYCNQSNDSVELKISESIESISKVNSINELETSHAHSIIMINNSKILISTATANKDSQTEFHPDKKTALLLCDRQCQCDENNDRNELARAKSRVDELEELLKKSELSKLEQIDNLRSINADMQTKCNELSKSLINFREEHDALKNKLHTTQLALVEATDENLRLERFKLQNASPF
jgi:hypothetical protein